MNRTKRLYRTIRKTLSINNYAFTVIAFLCLSMHASFMHAQVQAFYSAQAQPVRVSVILPFKTQQSEGARSLEFYRGLLLAAEDAKKMGLAIQISAFNEDKPEVDITPTITRAATQSDVFVGFYYRNHVIEAAKYTEANGKIAAFPMSTYIPVDLKNNRSCIFTATTTRQFVEKYAKIAMSTFGKCNIVYAHSTSAQNNSEMEDFAREMKSCGCKVHDISIDATSQAIKKQLATNRQNVVITNSNDINEISAFLANVKNVSVANPECRLSILGSSQWASYFNKSEIFANNDTYLPILANPNTNLPAAQALRIRYQDAFHCAPLNRAPSDLIDGYDFGMTLFEGMSKYGTTFMLYPSTNPHIANAYSFSNPNNGCWTNENVRLLHYALDGQQYLLEFKNK